MMKKLLVSIIPKELLLLYHKVLAILAAKVYGSPSDSMVVVGITGTDGKTSTTLLTSHLFESAGYKTAYITTAEFKIGQKKWINDTKQTMPGRFNLQKLLQEAKDAGCTHCIVETSSQGIEQFRHLGINYDTAVLTNLSHDHIEAHGSFENYKNEKKKLFKKITTEKHKKNIKKSVCVNGDDAHAKEFIAESNGVAKFVYAVEGGSVEAENNMTAQNLEFTDTETKYELTYNNQKEKIVTPLIGKFNVYNALAAASVVLAHNVSLDQIKEGLKKTEIIPGRLERIDEGQDFQVIVDYAHAEEALKNVYAAVKTTKPKRIISVLGSCGGGRDVAKRPHLGKIAAQQTDIVIVTNEDPYDEDPDMIIDQVANGAKKLKTENKNLFRISDREEAIQKALSLAQAKDAVVITGKGSEQCIMGPGNKKIPWDDRDVARRLLQNM